MFVSPMLYAHDAMQVPVQFAAERDDQVSRADDPHFASPSAVIAPIRAPVSAAVATAVIAFLATLALRIAGLSAPGVVGRLGSGATRVA
jgi:hypothetical protein